MWKIYTFNALTGGNERVGNWSGVTVERKSGGYCFQDISIEVVDLPGTYSLVTFDAQQSIDVRIACEYLLSGKVDVVINVIDASNLERNLFLTSQLLEMDVPVIIALNMMDIAKRRGIEINAEELSRNLGCQVVPIIANKQAGTGELKHKVSEIIAMQHKSTAQVKYPQAVVAGGSGSVPIKKYCTPKMACIAIT